MTHWIRSPGGVARCVREEDRRTLMVQSPWTFEHYEAWGKITRQLDVVQGAQVA
jgi:hypothetical protein